MEGDLVGGPFGRCTWTYRGDKLRFCKADSGFGQGVDHQERFFHRGANEWTSGLCRHPAWVVSGVSESA